MTTPTVDRGKIQIYDATGVLDNDELFTTKELTRYDAMLLHCISGAADVFGSLDGSNYSSSPISLQDLGATTVDPVVVMAAGRIYAVVGNYQNLRVLQNGGTAARVIARVWNMG